MQKTPVVAWIMLLILAFIWGSSFILIKKGLTELSPGQVGSLRIFSASLVLLPFALAKWKQIQKREVKYLIGAGLLGSLIPAFLFAIAQTELESAVTGVLNTLVPIFTLILAFFILGERQPVKTFLGIAIGFIGTAILMTAGREGAFNGINAYVFVVVLATLCYASNLLLIKEKLNEIAPLTVTSISLLLVGPIAGVHLFGFTDFSERVLSDNDILLPVFYISLLGVVGTALALIMFNRILQMTDALFTSSVTYIIPLFAIMWGVIDGEELTWLQYFGMLAVGIGVFLANRYRKIGHKKASD
ncbi:MAG: DMT family transporter [Bacteroidota bacterium]